MFLGQWPVPLAEAWCPQCVAAIGEPAWSSMPLPLSSVDSIQLRCENSLFTLHDGRLALHLAHVAHGRDQIAGGAFTSVDEDCSVVLVPLSDG